MFRRTRRLHGHYKKSDNIGDEKKKKGGRQLGKILLESKEPIVVGQITTDVDWRMTEGLGNEMASKTGVAPEHFLDMFHLNRLVAASISRAAFTPS